jgi:hypothetical protein
VAQAHARLRDAVDDAAVAPRHGLLLRGHDRETLASAGSGGRGADED